MNPGRPSFADRYRPAPGPEAESVFGAATAASRLPAGHLVAGRFLIERFAGAGGMAAVYRANDLATQSTVALKVMGRRRPSSDERFAREALLLSQISHPAVVRYVAHGLTDEGVPYLAMEWLSGEDLSSRLARSGLTVDETLALMRRICAGLSAVHDKGMTHRDITPGNLFLVDGRADSAKLLDFGIARQTGAVRTLTQAGAALGTIGYMAPEQALGVPDVDARADVFSLGCVLYECLTGCAAFSGAQDIAVLAKVLRDEVPRVRAMRPELDENLDELVASLLAKERSRRPRDAGSLLAALMEIGELHGAAASSARKSVSPRLVESEQRIASVIIARPEGPAAATLTPPQSDVEAAQLEDLLQRFGAQPIPLRAGQLLLVFGAAEGTIASDQAVQAVRCALRLRSLRPQLEIGVATGGLETAFNVSVGVAIDRAAALLDRSKRDDGGVAREPQASAGVLIDELTAGLLGGRFEVERSSAGLSVVTGVEADERPRLLLGEPSPCVGREKELGLLDATLAECIEDQVARVLLVTAQPGIGKSRLGREFLERIRTKAHASAFIARADPMSVRSALNLVQRLLHHAVGLREGEPLALRQARLCEHVDSLVDVAQCTWLCEFLGELVGVPYAQSPTPLLRAARNDPAVMREQTRRAVQQWLAAEVAVRPIVILLEDLQWGDLPSVNYLEEAVRALENRPILLLALARPDVHDHFPELFRSFGAQEVRLLGLTRRAAQRLARQVLPASADDLIIERIVELADGNAFYLEELIRHVAEGGTEFPETVRAIVQSRLEGLEPDARRHLRAASVFGETCWAGGVSALLGTSSDVVSWFERLAREEIFVQRPQARFLGEVEYVFRHALLRDAAYAMLTEGDRHLAHDLAGEWLEAAGERDACVLADHYERGTAPVRACPWLLRAARGALGS
ncbi:MAG: protein kinase, partial [Myxococcaceae bacterium]|nr:protein kinase [Myxococcaceae bacterium]